MLEINSLQFTEKQRTKKETEKETSIYWFYAQLHVISYKITRFYLIQSMSEKEIKVQKILSFFLQMHMYC